MLHRPPYRGEIVWNKSQKVRTTSGSLVCLGSRRSPRARWLALRAPRAETSWSSTVLCGSSSCRGNSYTRRTREARLPSRTSTSRARAPSCGGLFPRQLASAACEPAIMRQPRLTPALGERPILDATAAHGLSRRPQGLVCDGGVTAHHAFRFPPSDLLHDRRGEVRVQCHRSSMVAEVVKVTGAPCVDLA